MQYTNIKYHIISLIPVNLPFGLLLLSYRIEDRIVLCKRQHLHVIYHLLGVMISASLSILRALCFSLARMSGITARMSGITQLQHAPDWLLPLFNSSHNCVYLALQCNRILLAVHTFMSWSRSCLY